MSRDTGRSYWMPAAVPLTSTVNEIQFGTTLDAKADVDILGAVTNLSVSKAKLRDISGLLNVAAEYLPLFLLFGKKDTARHPFYWPRVFPLAVGNRLEVEVKNAAAAAEAAGHVIFVGVPNEPPMKVFPNLEELGAGPDGFSIDSVFSATLNEVTTKSSPAQSEDFVIHGAYTDLTSAQVRITGVLGELWNSDWTPVWGMAANSGSQLLPLLWPRPYYIPRGSTITVDFKNVGTEASGRLYFVGQRIN